MKAAIIVGGSILALLLLAVVAIGAGSYISAQNYGVSAEKQIEAQWTQNKNVLAQYGQKIQEAAQIPAMQRDDVAKVLLGTMGARYGKEGSQASMQWIKEQNPTLDSKVYITLQQIIEAGRDEFKNSQAKLIDEKRAYETNLGFFWSGMWLRIAGYPKVDLAKFNVVTTDRAENAFITGKESPIQLR